jgi:hypothetical protein
MNKGSAFIPEGLLPKHSDDPKRYNREYIRLRKLHDPVFLAHYKKLKNDATKRWQAKKKQCA